MTYRARVECDSVAVGSGIRLTTVEVEFPRIVLAEVVTHRRCSDAWGHYELETAERTTTKDISKNSGSSRAIPFKRMLNRVLDDPFIPERFSRNGPGMQGHGWLEGEEHEVAVKAWLQARDQAVEQAEKLYALGVHKQDVNRLLEPFTWVTQILTADHAGWNNFFALRCHKDAHPAFQKLARMIYRAYRDSTPTLLEPGRWHLPFVRPDEKADFYFCPDGADRSTETIPDLIQISAARCAWVSYENHDKDGTLDACKKTFARLMASIPRHASPVEHQATPYGTDARSMLTAAKLHSNLRGWIQARKLIPDEQITFYEPTAEEMATW